MKTLTLILLAGSSLAAQDAVIQNPVIGQVYTVMLDSAAGNTAAPGTLTINYLSFLITRAPNGDKTFTFAVYTCTTTYQAALPPSGLIRTTTCSYQIGNQFLDYGPVQAQISLFLDSYGDVLHRVIYAPQEGDNIFGGGPNAPHLATAVPTPPGDPSITMLDGFGNTLLQFDATNASLLSQVAVPSTVGPYGVRPALMGPQNEYWVANGASGIAVANLASQKVTATIATPSVPQGAIPVAIVFNNDGSGALEAFRYNSPDASGNSGLLLAFNAVSQAVTFTLPLKYAPTAFVMSPDGLTAYLLSSNGMITYFDVFSGTADLSLSTFTPGKSGGYPGVNTPVFVHPDGTRLFWNVGGQLESFDIATHQVTVQVNSGLPTTSGISMTLSPDGSLAYMSNGAGDVAVLDTRFGDVITTYTTNGASQVFSGPAQP